MGQYFELVNLDKKEYVSPWDINGVAKLWEWTANINECGVITSLLMARWANDRLVLLGDYDESKEYGKIYENLKKTGKYKNISTYAVDEYRIISTNYENNSKEKLYLINSTDNTYVKGSFKQISICLPVLLRQSTEGGGGDIDVDSHPSAGIFVGKKIRVTKNQDETEGLEDISSQVIKDAFDFYNS